MKNLLFALAFMLVKTFAFGQFSICNTQVTSVEVSNAGFSFTDGADFSKACIKITGTHDICNSDGDIVASGFTFTSTNVNCKNEAKSISNGSNNFPLPVELLGTSNVLRGKDIPVMYPNPNNGQFHLKTNQEINLKSFNIYNENGTKVKFEVREDDNGYIFNLNDLQAGRYFVKFENDGISNTQQIIVK